jgi:hypothetical protein
MMAFLISTGGRKGTRDRREGGERRGHLIDDGISDKYRGTERDKGQRRGRRKKRHLIDDGISDKYICSLHHVGGLRKEPQQQLVKEKGCVDHPQLRLGLGHGERRGTPRNWGGWGGEGLVGERGRRGGL